MIKFNVSFGPGWDTAIRDLFNIAGEFDAAVAAGHTAYANAVASTVTGYGWSSSSVPGFNEPNPQRNGTVIRSEVETESIPFVWVDEGVENYGFGGPGSGYKMNFQECYSAKTDGGSGEQSGRWWKGIEEIHSRGIRARNILSTVLDTRGDEVVAAMAAQLS